METYSNGSAEGIKLAWDWTVIPMNRSEFTLHIPANSIHTAFSVPIAPYISGYPHSAIQFLLEQIALIEEEDQVDFA